MNSDHKDSLLNKLILIGIALFFLAGIFSIQYYFMHQKNICISNPLVYGANQLKAETGYEFVGTGYFLTPLGFKSPIITFNSTSLTQEG